VRYQSSIRERSVQAMAQQYHTDWAHVQQVAKLALSLFDQSQILHGWGDSQRHWLWAAAMLHTIGQYVNHSAHHKHSYYLIRHGGLLGYSEEEIEIIANLARYHRNSPPKRRHEPWAALSKEQRAVVSQLSALLRLATALDRRRIQIIESVSLEIAPNSWTLTVKPRDPEDDCALELWDLESQKVIIEAEFNITLTVVCVVPVLGRA